MKNDEKVTLAEMMDLLFSYGEKAGIDVTYQAIGRIVGTSGNNIRKVHSGANPNPSLHIVQYISDYFGISLDYFNCRSKEECREYLAGIAALSQQNIYTKTRCFFRKSEPRILDIKLLQSIETILDYVRGVEDHLGELEDTPVNVAFAKPDNK